MPGTINPHNILPTVAPLRVCSKAVAPGQEHEKDGIVRVHLASEVRDTITSRETNSTASTPHLDAQDISQRMGDDRSC